MARIHTSDCTPPPPANPARRLDAVVLLVDDEPSVRKLTQRILEIFGLTVCSAESAEEAILVALSREDPIDVMLTDLHLPGMSGLELAKRVRAVRPGLPVVFVSGYPREEALAKAASELPNAEFVQKPFMPRNLIDALARVLAGRPRSVARAIK